MTFPHGAGPSSARPTLRDSANEAARLRGRMCGVLPSTDKFYPPNNERPRRTGQFLKKLRGRRSTSGRIGSAMNSNNPKPRASIGSPGLLVGSFHLAGQVSVRNSLKNVKTPHLLEKKVGSFHVPNAPYLNH
jgi:hypothetical protein